MPIPTLLHPVEIKIEIKRPDLTVQDKEFQEPIGKVVRETQITIPGQVYWQDQNFEGANVGVIDTMVGYALFRVVDLENKGIVLKEGDKIASVGKVADMPVGGPPFYLYRFQYRGHYPGLGATLLKAWFNSRAPVQ